MQKGMKRIKNFRIPRSISGENTGTGIISIMKKD
jgi:hypothetical protein